MTSNYNRREAMIAKYGPDYFKTIGRKGGKATGPKKQRAARVAGIQTRERMLARDPDYYKHIAKIGPKRDPRYGLARTASITCPHCLTAHSLPDSRIPHCVTCCGQPLWYFPH